MDGSGARAGDFLDLCLELVHEAGLEVRPMLHFRFVELKVGDIESLALVEHEVFLANEEPAEVDATCRSGGRLLGGWPLPKLMAARVAWASSRAAGGASQHA